ncbi:MULTISPECIES: amidohydrolase family protein [Paraburkholderia]|jgi:predicted TIM-barrel fold metal-dependent hydrolase|uniref:2-pyrone-4,6-dicarboxylate hydrolase n=1 Tax=Paraburkholderia hospita TaxID=169430 RepID=A0AAN1JJ81_9BURK|nr:amidohydrolase family protein [Paraburkholderia hospita]SKC96059.1 Predicted metal-dependent hydrolase, TIM-barrel fold [Burkholderia sp. CF099]AUT75043.1 2-pyrone-4,6-dicarboxylate hydrolase [Paraburkholderia hospita]EIM93306.1 amidohydrolase 2 [Paraburkholderia hospita]OUL75847.1 2-pyrone-4,6-dicarboxylate hydrolase [Paraburkholderia hospita]OUL80762.1 2-pyrone-4,6-dicarboxylate hydrolase [Paraburkholderia hospita]
MSVFDEDKIDCHCHIFDPVRFPYRDDTAYRPAQQEIGTAAQFVHVMDAYGVRHALLVGPTSGYRTDNRCLLDALETYEERFRGIAVVDNDIGRGELVALRRAGVVGVAFNPAMEGVELVRDAGALFALLADLGMFAQIQVCGDQLVALAPWLAQQEAQLLIDHGGRPDIEAGVAQPGFQALLRLADSARASVKLSGWQKYSRDAYPYEDAWPYAHALLGAFGPQRCVWGSDWPFLRAPERLDYGPLLTLFEQIVPDAETRHQIQWETPRRLFGFDAQRS